MKIISVRFRKTGKLFKFKTCDERVKLGDIVLGESDKGLELARVVKIENNDENIDFKELTRIATRKDIEIQKNNEKEAKELVKFAKEEALKLKLDMKFLFAEYTFDRSKITFYFTSNERVDFRELVKVLAAKIHSRIELRQIGPRDEVKVFENVGPCGREVCCRTFLQDFESVTIKDVKEQGLQINMPKISGACGRLMCCLKYEQELYKENIKKLPKINSIVSYEGKKGKVIGNDILNLKVRVLFEDTNNVEILNVKDINFKEV